MSFGMIFSIILIIAFLAFAFYAIKNFLGMQQEIQINQFTENFQGDVDRLWKSTAGNKTVEYTLPSKIGNVCFIIDDFNNLLLYNSKNPAIFTEYNIKNIDIFETVGSRESLCKKPVEGKISFKLQKDYNKPLVKIILN